MRDGRAAGARSWGCAKLKQEARMPRLMHKRMVRDQRFLQGGWLLGGGGK